MSIYTNKTRNSENASQSENIIIIEENNLIIVDSYQKFKVNNTQLYPLDEQLIKKSALLKPILKNFSIHNSILDIGSSNGYFTYLANSMNYKKCDIVEHDKEFIDKINYINDKYHFPK